MLPAGTDIPWQRVVSSSGAISKRGGGDGEARQIAALAAEGVNILATTGGGGKVDLREFAWVVEDDVYV